MSYSIVLPLTCGHGFPIFAQIGLKYYEKYINPKELDFFYLIAPKADLQKIIPLTIDSPLPFRFISDESILDSELSHGWLKQQIIKLIMARIIRTETYLVVDYDMFPTTYINYDELHDYESILYHSEPWQTQNGKYYSQNSAWWESSCNILNYDITKLHNKADLMCVTPQILNTSIVKELIIILEKLSINNSSWQKQLSDRKFTEYTLYWIYLIQTNRTGLYFTSPFPLWNHNIRDNLLDPSDYDPNFIKRITINPSSIFTVIQGWTVPYLKDLQCILDQGKESLSRKDIDAIVLTSSAIIPKRFQSYTTDERFQHTLQTRESVRKYLPNSIHVLIEGSDISSEYEQILREQYDYVLMYNKDSEVQQYVNHPYNIGYGENALLIKGSEFVQNELLKKYNPKNIFKLGGRYSLTDEFKFSRFRMDKFTFMTTYDTSLKMDVYKTGLYSIPVRYLDFFKNILKASLNTEIQMVEKMYKDMIPQDRIHTITKLGLQGSLSYNKKFFKE